MSDSAPAQEWWSASELAEAGLPDVPGTKRKVNEMARREAWANLPGKVRRRRGAGGGVEYHWSLLPLRARLRLGGGQADPQAAKPRADEAWARHEAAGDAAREEAQRRLGAIGEVAALEAAGLTRSMAVREVARGQGCSAATVWNWLRMIEGVAAPDRLAYLVDGRAVRAAPGARVDLDDGFLALVRSDWLRLSQPSLTSCYDRAVRLWQAEKRNSPVPPIHQVRRRIKAEVSKPTEVFMRKGAEAPERFNGRIEEVLQSHHFRSGEELEATLHRYVWLYNQHLPQSALGSKTPLQAMKDWHKLKPALFKKQPYYLPGCDRFLASVDGCHVVTVKHLSGADGALHPVQQTMVAEHGSQCGFCTPGIVMALYALWMQTPAPDETQIETALQGNLCRCTGYAPVIRAAQSAIRYGTSAADRPMQERDRVRAALAAMHDGARVVTGSEEDRAILPADVDDFAGVLADNPHATIVAGATDVGLRVTKFLRPIGDTPPTFIALGASITLRHRSARPAPPFEAVFVGYGKQDRAPGEFVEEICIPRLAPD